MEASFQEGKHEVCSSLHCLLLNLFDFLKLFLLSYKTCGQILKWTSPLLVSISPPFWLQVRILPLQCYLFGNILNPMCLICYKWHSIVTISVSWERVLHELLTFLSISISTFILEHSISACDNISSSKLILLWPRCELLDW